MINSLKGANAKDSIKKDDNVNKETKNLFLKGVTCPVCKNSFRTPTVKVNAPRITSRDSDLFIRYSVENPYFYEVWLCPSCGYAALKTDFNKIREFQIKLVKEKLLLNGLTVNMIFPLLKKLQLKDTN